MEHNILRGIDPMWQGKCRWFCVIAVIGSLGLLGYLLSFTSSFQAEIFNLDWRGWFTITLFFIIFTALVKELFPPDLILLVGAAILVVTGVIKPEDFLRGYAQDVIVILAMLFIIARALEINGILSILAGYALPRVKRSMRRLLTMMLPLSAASAFLNNTPIVLLLTPVIRKWALERKMRPSKFLIPLSYATILGGSCTLIGTSSNLVVDGLLRTSNGGVGFTFFELAYVGVPFVLVGYLYMAFVGHKLLPERVDATTAAAREMRAFTSEFVVKGGCPLIDRAIGELTAKYFKGQQIIEIERGQMWINAPTDEEVILEGDRLVFISDIETVARLHGIEGLSSTADPHFKLDVTSSHFSEVVIASTSSLIGKTLRASSFRKNYGASVLAVYRQGKRVSGDVGSIMLRAGDTLMLFCGEEWGKGITYNNDFFYMKYGEKVPVFRLARGMRVLVILIAMISAAVAGVPMMTATLVAVFALFVTKSISIRDARMSIRWNLLVLVGSAFSFGDALRITGVANVMGQIILCFVGTNQYLFIALIFLITLIVTDLITNNAAALLLFPIALQAMKLAGFSSSYAVKAVAVTVAIAASSSFVTPIGYQTNTIVYGPGGYKFSDYMRVGIPLSVILWILGTFLIPTVWPLA
jgi:di/tricarboxylate transporter